MLGDEELLKPPYSIENQAHRRAVLAELDRIKALGFKPPQNLWEYKVSTKHKYSTEYFILLILVLVWFTLCVGIRFLCASLMSLYKKIQFCVPFQTIVLDTCTRYSLLYCTTDAATNALK